MTEDPMRSLGRLVGKAQRHKTNTMLMLGSIAVLILAAVICSVGQSGGSHGGGDERRSTPTTRATPDTVAEKCFSPWDGNHDGMERQIRALLKDPDSMVTHGTYYNGNDDLSDGTMTIRMDYGARNSFGGMVRNNAIGEMNIRNCAVTLLDIGE